MRSRNSRVIDFQLKNFATKLPPAKYSIVIPYLSSSFTCEKVHEFFFLSAHLFNHLYVNPPIHCFIPQSIRPFCRP